MHNETLAKTVMIIMQLIEVILNRMYGYLLKKCVVIYLIIFFWQCDSTMQEEHPRGSIVELLGLHQDDLNSLSYNGLDITIIIAHVYDIL